MWDTIKKSIGQFAPTIATAIGTPLMGSAVSILCKALGLNDNSSEAQIKDAVAKMTPADVLALKKAEQDYALECKKADIDLTKATFADKDSARQMSIQNKDTLSPRILAVLSIVLFLLTSSFIAFMMLEKFYNPDLNEIDAGLMALIGSINGASAAYVKQAYDFYMGSSAGSQDKNNLLYNSIPKE